jgi:hypothetical protein
MIATVDRALGLAEIGRIDFRTSRSGDTATMSLLQSLELQFRYQPARLAIAKSLGLPSPPPAVDNLDGKVIRGETLFGSLNEDLGAWVSLLTGHASTGPIGRRELQDLVAAHWARGAGLLWDAARGHSDPLLAITGQLLRWA